MKNESTIGLPLSIAEIEAEEVIERLDREHGRALFATVCKQCRSVIDPTGCLDVYQDVLLSIWMVVKRKIDLGIYVSDNPMRLALGVAKRVIRNAKRKARRNPWHPLADDFVALGRPSGELDDEFKKNVLAAFATLTPIQRRVMDAYLAYVDEFGKIRGGRYRQIACDLSITPDTVRSVFRRAMSKIKSYLKGIESRS